MNLRCLARLLSSQLFQLKAWTSCKFEGVSFTSWTQEMYGWENENFGSWLYSSGFVWWHIMLPNSLDQFFHLPSSPFRPVLFPQVFIFRCQGCRHSSQLSSLSSPHLPTLALSGALFCIHSSLIVPDFQVPRSTCLNIVSEGRVFSKAGVHFWSQ